MRWFAAIAFVGLLWAQSEGRQIPTYPGDGNPQHNGQPRWCQSDDSHGYMHNCACIGMTGSDGHTGMCEGKDPAPHGDPLCKTYCRRSACSCHAECDNSTR